MTMIQNFKQNLPNELKILLRFVVTMGQRGLFRLGLRMSRPQVPSSNIAVYDGGSLTQHEGLVHGGKVKLLHLQRRFPGDKHQFNVLYLVSSGQPRFALSTVRWARRHGAKFVWNQNGVAFPAWAKGDLEKVNGPMRKLFELADFVIYQSEFCRTSAERYLGVAQCPSKVLYNCVDTSFFSPATVLPPTESWVLLAAGTHQQDVRVLRVLDVLATLHQRGQQARLLLAGRLDWPGADKQVREYITRLGLGEFVELVPPFTQAEAPALYCRAHVLIHLQYKDSCPTVPIEAMACGLPVVGSHSGGLPELVGEEGGLLLHVPDTWDRMEMPGTESIAAAVESIFKDLQGWRSRARSRAESHFDCEHWLDGHAEIFSSLLPEMQSD
jgi:glycosyltransferase involved in cell wall biosynthesis